VGVVTDLAGAHETGDSPLLVGRHVPGEPGIWVLLFGDLGLFTVLFAVYLQHRGA
jgi:hypothetical protein